MGEIAEMMLDGTLCEGCGVYLGSDSGFPTYCSACRRDQKSSKGTHPEKIPCPQCGRQVKEVGLEQHMKDVHGKDAA